MNKLMTELQRLYFLPEQQWWRQGLDDAGEPAYSAAGLLSPAALAASLAGEASVELDPVGADGRVRLLLLNFKRAGDWEQVAKVYQAVQSELELPAPAVSISGRAGYRLWFSLAEPVALAQACEFLEGLRRQYLAELPAASLELCPDSAGQAMTQLVPAFYPATGKWSAFIDPSMGNMFMAEPGLEMAPGLDKQADILARFESIKAAAFQQALGLLRAEPEVSPGLAQPENLAAAGASQATLHEERGGARLNLGSHYSDPKSFLLAVMNDPSASARQRIRAAKALLPYFADKPSL